MLLRKNATISNYSISPCLLDLILPCLSEHSHSSVQGLQNNFRSGQIYFISCAVASCLAIGIGLNKETGLLLWKTSIIYSCRAFFAKSVKIISQFSHLMD